MLSARSRICGGYFLPIVFDPCLKNGTKVSPIHGPNVEKMGRRYRIRVDVCDNLVQVCLVGSLAITHTLAAGDATMFRARR